MGQKLKNQVILALGSNLGNRKANLEQCISLISERLGEVEKTSSLLNNPPSGFNSMEEFTNMCIKVRTPLQAREIMHVIKEIEQKMGRVRNQNFYEDRIIDIDIILLNEECIKSEKLVIPHLKYHTRTFVLQPLSELGDFIDPNVFLCTNQFLN